ncbi:DNA gyrase subunit A [Candidatus Peregrinibacteria bacterium]|jgi:DNA gyrase subunit A|nr:DNA gyrase subunit A [Candidatus Peregrinibacteria bacterium]
MSDEENGANEESAPQNEDEIKEVEEGNPEEPKTQLFDPRYKARAISDEMEESYLDYAMSVIVSRALPDVRDGLKPVHRRILYVMHESGLRASAKFRKSANVVGEVLGKYHPHGDSAVYDSMVRMAQSFSLRYPLVNGQGNFGSIDGDSAAAYRYTEAKMQKIAEEMLADIDKDTVDWVDNYDTSRQEPRVLPSKLPQLLLNGTMGIAVGMATNIPPHNLGELVDGIIALIGDPELTVEDLMEYIKGPDFPTYGMIYDTEAIKAMYVNGRGGIAMRARAEIEERKGGKFHIRVNEIPYQVNKANLIEKIADLVRSKKIVGITDIRDESSRDEIRIIIELKRDSYPKKVLNQLYKMTAMQTSFNMNMIALVEGIQPRLLNLKEVLSYFIAHRKIVITRKTEYELRIAKARAHILEGLKIALNNIDAVIETIKKSKTKEDAASALEKKFKLTDKQSAAILEMRLQTLAGLEQQKIEDEYNEKIALITELESILGDPQRVLNILKDELAELKEKYGDPRRTEIIPHAIGEFSAKDTIPNSPMLIILTKENYIKRVPPTSFRTQHRGGKGIIGMNTKEEDEIRIMRYVKNHDDLYYFTNKGRVFKLPAYEIPQTSRTAKGQAIVNLLQLEKEERVTAILKISEQEEGKYLFMGTSKGTVKKTPIAQFHNVRRNGLIAIKLRPEDELEWVKQTSGDNRVVIATREGKCIQFDEHDVRSMGRPSMGVRGIRLKPEDEVIQMDIVREEGTDLLIVTENGLGKRTPLSSYRFQARGGSGVKTANLSEKTGKIIGAAVLEENIEGDIIMVSKEGQIIRLEIKSIPTRGRATQGVYLMRVKKKDRVASISLIRNEIGMEEAEENEQTEAELEEKPSKAKKAPKKEAEKPVEKKDSPKAPEKVKVEPEQPTLI